MKCQDCVEKKAKYIEKAEFVLVDYDSVKILCPNCLSEYSYAEGEMNLDFYHMSIGLTDAFKRIDEILKYHTEQYTRLLRGYTELKKNRTSGEKANETV